MFIFSEEKRRQLQEERPELSESELTRLLARMWNDLSEKKKVRPWGVWHQPPLRAAWAPSVHAVKAALRPAGVDHTCARQPEGGKLSAGDVFPWKAAPWVGRSLRDISAAHGLCWAPPPPLPAPPPPLPAPPS